MAEQNIGHEKHRPQNSLRIEMIGSYWFLEVDGKLNRLKFLTNEKNVRLQGNVIFTDESVYQVHIDDKNNVKLIKIEDIDHRSVKGTFAAPLEDCSEALGNSKTDKGLDISNITLEPQKGAEEAHDNDTCDADEDDTHEILEMGHDEYISDSGTSNITLEPQKGAEEAHDSDTCDADEDNTHEILEMGHDEYISDSEEEGDIKQQDEAHPITVIAAHDFKAHLDDEIAFWKGELLTVDSEAFSQDYNIWVPATHLKTGQTGFIPRRFVNRNVKSPVFESCWFNLDKEEAERMLSSSNKPGTFLIRNSSDGTSLALSVKCFFYETRKVQVIHYIIQRLEMEKVALPPTKIFDNIHELISFYKRDVGGLCCKLSEQCQKVEPTVEYRDVETSRKSVTIIRELYSFSTPSVVETIYIGTWCDKQVAVKEQRCIQTMGHNFLTEIGILKHLNCKRLVKLMAVHTKSEPFMIITEFMINGLLSKYLRSGRGKTLQLKDLTYIIRQIADGMDYLGHMQIVHRDLRASNILVGHENEVKIGRFWLARQLKNGIYLVDPNETYLSKWTAPEAASKEGRFSEKSDVYSFGVVLYEIITYGRRPYSGMNIDGTLDSIKNGFRMRKPSACPESYYAMMLRCWNKEPESRPTFAYLKEYFSDYKACAQNDCVTHL